MGQKLFDFQGTHRVGMLDAMKSDISLRPLHIASLRPNGETLHPRQMTNLIEQFHENPLCQQFSPKSGVIPPPRQFSCNSRFVPITDKCTYVQIVSQAESEFLLTRN